MGRAETCKVVTEWLLIGMFAALLGVPLFLAIVGPHQVYSSTEKRFLAKFPELQPGTIGVMALARSVDQYYQDHFGLREFLIHRYHREVNKRFADAGAPNVVTGNDGWLFYSGEQVLDDLIGRHPLSGQQLAQLAARISTTRQWLQGQGISYLPLVAPDKQSIYPEYLPEAYQQAKGTTRLDQAIAALNQDPATAILDLRPVLLRNKGAKRLYDKTDTHWNELGAYCAYQELLRVIAGRFPGEDQQGHFSVGGRWREKPAGDLAQLAGRGDTLREQRPVVLAGLRARVKELSPSLRALLSLQQLQPALTVRQGRKLRVLVLHDSFMNPMKLFLSEEFGEVLYVWKYFDRNIDNFLNREVMSRLLTEFKPDLVIDEVVERHLDWWITQDGPPGASVSAR